MIILNITYVIIVFFCITINYFIIFPILLLFVESDKTCIIIGLEV